MVNAINFIWGILSTLACTLWHKITIYNYPVYYSSSTLLGTVFFFSGEDLPVISPCKSSNLKRGDRVRGGEGCARQWGVLVVGLAVSWVEGTFREGEAWSNDHMELERSGQECCRCSGTWNNKFHVLVISAARRRPQLNSPHFFQLKIQLVKRQKGRYHLCLLLQNAGQRET